MPSSIATRKIPARLRKRLKLSTWQTYAPCPFGGCVFSFALRDKPYRQSWSCLLSEAASSSSGNEEQRRGPEAVTFASLEVQAKPPLTEKSLKGPPKPMFN